MKKIQNNFTTLEQSKKLLKLGMPANSSDCYFGSYSGYPDWAIIRQSEFDTEDDALFRLNEDIIPCWSVGRLIEVYCTCRECTWEYITNNPPIEDILCDIELHIDDLDFSKLDEI